MLETLLSNRTVRENAYFIKMREDEFKDSSCADILKTMCGLKCCARPGISSPWMER